MTDKIDRIDGTSGTDRIDVRAAITAAGAIWLVALTAWGANSTLYLITVFGLPLVAGFLVARVPLPVRIVAPALLLFILDDWLIGDGADVADWWFFLAMAALWALIGAVGWAGARMLARRRPATG